MQDEEQIEWIGGWDADTCTWSRQKGPSGNPVDEPLNRIVAQIEGEGYTPSELQSIVVTHVQLYEEVHDED